VGEDTRKPSAARRPATTAARLVPAVLAGSGNDRGALALSESARTVAGSPSDVAGWTGAYVTARTARARSGLKWMCPRRQRVSARGCVAWLLTPTGRDACRSW